MSDNHEYEYDRSDEVFEVNVHDASTQETEVDVKVLGYAVAYVKITGKEGDDLSTAVITGANGMSPDEIAIACYGLLEMHPEAKSYFDEMIVNGAPEPIEIELDDKGNVKNSDYDEYI